MTYYDHVVWYDFEACTDTTPHRAYSISYILDNEPIKSFWGFDCAYRFLERLPNKTLCIAHNQTYDMSFIIDILTIIYQNPIIKNGHILMLGGAYIVKVFQGKEWVNEKHVLWFKDSYAIISKPLRCFPQMFQLDSGPKEVFPYQFYSYERLCNKSQYGLINEALEYIPSSDKDQFINNLHELNIIQGDKFDMIKYCQYYNERDVQVLKSGFETFRKLLLESFNLDAFNFVSISSIANRYMELNCYWKNNNLYDLANTPREFISRCIIGGRCMLSDNTKSINEEEPIVDFDAVSLYPSAIHRLYLLEGIPHVLQPEQLNTNYLLSHLFEDEQQEPTPERFISGFFIEAQIVKVGIKRHFPLIVWNHDINGEPNHERATNDNCIMYMDHITFQDLITYQRCIIQPIRGYYYKDKRDYSCREVIENLFNLRLKYKAQNNPLQEIIKLILNSIYGKTILKPINESYKFIPTNKLNQYIANRYNYIKELTGMKNSPRAIAREVKPFNRHYSFVSFGVNVLSMSKRIMNEVICTAEDLRIPIFYQDTDSIHIHRSRLDELANEFKKRYNRELIGKQLGMFHPDFSTFGSTDEMPIAIRSIFVMKKTYIDQLQNSSGEIAYHIRMKGVTPDVIVKKANELHPEDIQCYYSSDGLVYPIDSTSNNAEYSIYHLYKDLFNGQAIEFDLCESDKPCFEFNDFHVSTKDSFIRKISLSEST